MSPRSILVGRERWLLLAVALAAPLAFACPGQSPEALAWLERMSRSLDSVSYHGIVTLRRGDDLQLMQVAHRVEGAVATDQMTQLTGQGVRVDRHDHPLGCVHPGHQLLRMSDELAAGRCGIAEQYRIELGGDVAVAHREAVQISIEPRDVYRFGYVMAIDRETGLLLRAQTLDQDHQQPLEVLEFVRVFYGGGEAELLDGERVYHAAHPKPGRQTHVRPVSRPWLVGWMPEGFTLTDPASAQSGRRTYTDGLAVFSVFLEDLELAIKPGEGIVREGGTISYTRGMELDGHPVLVTVLGEVPLNTARMVADSVRWER